MGYREEAAIQAAKPIDQHWEAIKAAIPTEVPCYGDPVACRMDDHADCNDGCMLLAIYRAGFTAGRRPIAFARPEIPKDVLTMMIRESPEGLPGRWDLTVDRTGEFLGSGPLPIDNGVVAAMCAAYRERA